jgi:chromosome segregation ATPase
MTDIIESERRLAAAIERIRTAAERLSERPSADPDAGVEAEVARLREALDAERLANAQLTERVRAIKDKQETMVAALERNVARLTEQLDAQAAELNRLKRTNAQLTESNRTLLVAAERGLIEPHQIDSVLKTELDALRAARAADVAEMDAILNELKPLIGEVA